MHHELFLQHMCEVADESFRVLKKGGICAIMMGDMRSRGKVVPLGFQVMNCFINAKLLSEEIIIKNQHNCRSTKHWERQNHQFLLLAHEYIFIFTK